MSADRHSLVDEVVEELLRRILSGEIAPESALPSEAEIAESTNVSRLTTREAVKVLRAQNIVYIRRGVGTFVNPTERWTSLEAVLRALSRGTAPSEVRLKLLEARRIVEIGASELAATRHQPEDLLAMSASIAAMEDAHARGDAAGLAGADIAFHDAVLAASGNRFVPALLGGLSGLLYSARLETSAFPEIQQHAIEQHRSVLAAIESGDTERARRAMESHMRQTYLDYERYLPASGS